MRGEDATSVACPTPRSVPGSPYRANIDENLVGMAGRMAMPEASLKVCDCFSGKAAPISQKR
jgi:hypothetical protein